MWYRGGYLYTNLSRMNIPIIDGWPTQKDPVSPYAAVQFIPSIELAFVPDPFAIPLIHHFISIVVYHNLYTRCMLFYGCSISRKSISKSITKLKLIPKILNSNFYINAVIMHMPWFFFYILSRIALVIERRKVKNIQNGIADSVSYIFNVCQFPVMRFSNYILDSSSK